MVLPKLEYADPKIETFKSFIAWTVLEGQGTDYLPRGYAPLPRELSASAIRISQAIGQAQIPKPTVNPPPTPTPTPTPIESAGSDFNSGPTTTVDQGTGGTGGVSTTTQAVRLSAFTEPQIAASPIGRLLIFVLLGLFAGSAISTLRPRK